MRLSYLAVVAIVPLQLCAQPQTTLTSAGGTFVAHAGSYSGQGRGLSGSADFFCNSVSGDYAFRDMWSYRIQGDLFESRVASDSLGWSETSDSFHGTMLKGQNGVDDASNPMVQIDVYYTLSALSPTVPLLEKCVTITNLTSQTLDFALFHYMDYDIAGTTTDQITSHAFNGTTDDVIQSSVANPGNFASTTFTGVGGNVGFQHDFLYDNFFSNSVIDTMNDVVTGGSGDLAVGFQLDATLAPGQTSVCPGCATALNGVVPEPSLFFGLAAGVAAGMTALGSRTNQVSKRK